MLCERCKIREATIKYTEIVNGVKTEHNLCSHCAKELDLGQYSAILEGDFPLGKLLSGLLGLEDDEDEAEYQGPGGMPYLRIPALTTLWKTAGLAAGIVTACLTC